MPILDPETQANATTLPRPGPSSPQPGAVALLADFLKDCTTMALMDWTEALSVGVRELDEDHQQMIGLINQIDDGLDTGRTPKELAELLHRLVNLTKSHQRHEEDLLSRCQFPGAQVQFEHHDDILGLCLRMQARYRSDSSYELTHRDAHEVSRVLLEHIQGPDMDYGHFLNQHGIH